MQSTSLLMFSLITVVTYANQDRPRVAWVPIEGRNISEVVGRALEEKDERLVRIGKMLTESYDKMARDTAEGEEKIRQLEESNPTAKLSTTSAAVITFYFSCFYS